ncbi:MAG TPA: LexA family transcriptional regulator [Caulobacteraceae bacterium]|nr:LexA family transcriptional regulator [Caulobacteraceae bacterium]
MDGKVAAHVAKGAGLPPQTLDGYLKGSFPSADRAFALADSLGVDPRWLVLGVGEPHRSFSDNSDDDWLVLPHFDVRDFGEHGKPEPKEHVRLRRDWLQGIRASTGLWLADMPSDAMPEIAREGQTIVCQDPTSPLVDGRVYIFMLDGRLVVRKLQFRPDGIALRTNDPSTPMITLTGDHANTLIPVARVLGTINLSPV